VDAGGAVGSSAVAEGDAAALEAYLDKWVTANKLSRGEHLKTPNGATVTVVGGTAPKVRDGWMWDLTVPGNDDHDFYVEAATAVVLVHNCAAPRKGGGANDAPSWVSREAGSPQPGENAQQYATRILNDKYGEGNWPKGAGSEFSKIVKWVTRGGRLG